MTPDKSRLLDDFVSPKVVFGRSKSPFAREAAEALKSDERYQRLRERLEKTGFFERAPKAYAIKIALLLGVFGLSFVVLLTDPGFPLRVLCWAAIGFVLVQGGFVSHEATHGAVSRSRVVTQAVGQCFQTLLVGLAFSYFWRSHELHHFHVNEEDSDPDTQSDLLSVFASSAREKRGVGRFLTRFQHVFIVLLSPGWGIGLKWDALTYVLRNPRKTRLDQAMLLLHVLLWGGVAGAFLGPVGALVNYFGWLSCASVYMFLVIPFNHIGTRKIERGESISFLEQQVATTRNLPASPLRDFLLMGQTCHVEHHLFPNVPVGRLRRGREVLRAFCREENLPYVEMGYVEAMRAMLRHLAVIARGSAVRSAQAHAIEQADATTR